jgi:hypothetical protein
MQRYVLPVITDRRIVVLFIKNISIITAIVVCDIFDDSVYLCPSVSARSIVDNVPNHADFTLSLCVFQQRLKQLNSSFRASHLFEI